MTKVNFYDSIDDSMLKFAVIIAKHNGKWVFCKHRERSTWEVCKFCSNGTLILKSAVHLF